MRGWLSQTENPRQRGKPLTEDLAGMWKYRIGDYRLICDLHDAGLVVLIVKAGHRSKIYKRK
jgi:mRNA interferase RelE/StbE